MKDIIDKNPVIAIIRNVSNLDILPYMMSLYHAGLRCFEISISHGNAIEQIHNMKQAMPEDTLIGAGTVLDVQAAEKVLVAGADFILSPSTNAAGLAYCKKNKVRLLPGVMTPTDVSVCQEYGFFTLKLFPAGELPLDYNKSLKGPFPGTSYVAVGGVSPQNAIDYFNHGYCGVGIGSALVNKKDLKEKNWDKITEDVKQFYQKLCGQLKEEKVS